MNNKPLNQRLEALLSPRYYFMYSAEIKIYDRISSLGFAPVGYDAGSF